MSDRVRKLQNAAEQAQREWEQAIDATDAARTALERARLAEREAHKRYKMAVADAAVAKATNGATIRWSGKLPKSRRN
jgi:hypothetical protein